METKTKVLEKMNKELKDLERRIVLVESLEIAPVDEETWHEICLTPMRYERATIKAIAQQIFPQGEKFVVTPNEVIFRLNGFKVELPTTNGKGVLLDIRDSINPNGYRQEYREPFVPSDRYREARGYLNSLLEDSKDLKKSEDSWYNQAMYHCINPTIKENKTKLFIWWLTVARKNPIDLSKLYEQIENEDYQNEINLQKHSQRVEEMNRNLILAKQTIEILEKFAKVIRYDDIEELDK